MAVKIVTAKDRSTKARASTKKSETLTLRLDPKAKFMIEFLGLVGDRNITAAVERAVKTAADRTRIDEVYDREGELVRWKTWEDFWHISEGVRRLNMIKEASLRKNYEDDELLEFVRFHIEFFSEKNSMAQLDYIRVDIIWPKIGECLELWRKRTTSGPWLAGSLMAELLEKAGISAPKWPRKSTTPPDPIREQVSQVNNVFDDEIPF